MNISLNVDVHVKDGALVLTNQEGNIITFSPEQSVQRKVSMITMGELCNLPKINVAQAFGFKSRKSYYDVREAVLHGEIFPKRTGPQSATKRTRELEALIIQSRYEKGLNMYEITALLTQLGFHVSSSLVASVLADFGLCKKNL